MRVAIPSPLRSYTAGREEVQARGATLAALLADLDASFPGIRFRIIDEQGRIRVHIRIFVNADLARELGRGLSDQDDVQILCALSGG